MCVHHMAANNYEKDSEYICFPYSPIYGANDFSITPILVAFLSKNYADACGSAVTVVRVQANNRAVGVQVAMQIIHCLEEHDLFGAPDLAGPLRVVHCRERQSLVNPVEKLPCSNLMPLNCRLKLIVIDAWDTLQLRSNTVSSVVAASNSSAMLFCLCCGLKQPRAGSILLLRCARFQMRRCTTLNAKNIH